jgi:HTH-type transcriptional regulator / antitoxin HipB
MRIRTPRELGAVLRDERRRLGLSQIDLSERADVSRKWIVQMENGKARAELALVLRALGALGLVMTVERGAETKHKTGAGAVDIDAIVAAARRVKS